MAETNGATNVHAPDNASKQSTKTFVPLENNPEVFTALLRSLHVSSSLTLHDIYSFDSDALAHIPRPAHALLFIVPAAVYHRSRQSDRTATSIDPYVSSGANEPVLWFRQTIGHSCGLMAMLHALANGSGRHYVPGASPLSGIFDAAVDMKPEPRAKLIYDSEFLESAHASAAQMGDTVAPSPEEPNGFHYITFVKGDDGHLWELEGGWKGPIDRGLLDENEDVLTMNALELGPQPFLKFIGNGDMDSWFSCVALCGQRQD